MPRVTLMQTNFTAGEISPRLLGRVDIARYSNGAKIIENACPMVYGGVIRRPGSRFITSTKFSNKKSRLIPYVFNKNQAYIIEFGDCYMRVYKDGAQVMGGDSTPYEVPTPYTEAMLDDIDYVQGADTMFIAHPGVPIYRLRRQAHDDWSLAAAPFVVTPFSEIGFRPATTLTLSASSIGTGRTLTAGAATFLRSDVGREVWSGAGIAKIAAFTSSTVVTADISIPFSTVSKAAAGWLVTGSPQGEIVPSVKEPVGASVTLCPKYLGDKVAITSLVADGAGTATATVVSHGLFNGDKVKITGCNPAGFNTDSSIVSVTDANTFTYPCSVGVNEGSIVIGGSDPPPPTPVTATDLGSVYKVVDQIEIWRPDDVGKFVQINRGLIEITAYTSPTLVTGTIRAALDATVAAPANAWTLEGAVWNATDGYPRTVSLHEQRLIAAGSPGYPQTVWMSRTGEYLNFEQGTKDDDSISFTISSDQINPIAHLGQIRALIALTYGGEFTLTGGVEKPILPTNIQVKNQSVYGCNSVRPIRIGNELYFIQRANRKLRAMAYKYETDAYGAPDLSVLAEHATNSGIVDMAYQQEPGSVIWLVRADGVMATVTIDRDQDVVGWARHITDGAFESVATIPVADGEEVWAVVRRTVNGATMRYIERFDPDLCTDASITGTHATGAATWTGLGHLEGKEVDILADGVVMQRMTVRNGQITLDRKATAVEIGLAYTTTIETLTPEIAGGTGSAQGNSMRIAEVVLRFHETTGAELNGTIIPFRNFGRAVLDAPAPLFTGDHRVETLGWERGAATLVIQQRQPLPFHLLAVIKKFTVND